MDEKARQKYLRSHIHGIESDDFAREIGRLSLTLADVPNANSWDLVDADMYSGHQLAKQVKRAGVVLANPPFENFTEKERHYYKKQPGLGIFHVNKAAELFARVVANLPAGGVFGLVMPESVLSSHEGKSFRTQLVRDYELREVCLLPDKLFENSEIESAVVLGRRRSPAFNASVYVRRVYDWDLKGFGAHLVPSTESKVPQSSFLLRNNVNLRLPDLPEVWDFLRSYPRLQKVADVQKGFEFKSRKVRQDQSALSDPEKKGWRKAYLRADDGYAVYSSPTPTWIPYSPAIRRARGGGPNPDVPQVVLNHVRAGRRQWRLKPFIDTDGCPVTSNFLVFRPKKELPLSVLWAILMSPVANAYAFAVTSKKHTLATHWRDFPLPPMTANDVASIASAASVFREAAIRLNDGRVRAGVPEQTVHRLLLDMDAAVLKAYALPPALEQRLLSIFNDVERPGVGCRFTSYPQAPTSVHLPFHLRLLLPRFHELVDLRLAGRIKPQQQEELADIEGRFDAYEQESPNDAAFGSWMKELDQRHAKAASKLDAIEAKFRKRAAGGVA